MTRLSTATLAIVTLATLFSFGITNQAVAQQSQNPYYFGMNVQLIRNNFGQTALQVVSVTPGGPAQFAGLEPGDQILTQNGQNFSQARDSFEAVRMMNYYVQSGGTGVAPAAPAAGAAATVFVSPNPRPSAQMSVRDVRTGNNVYVTVHPTPSYTTPGGPVIAPAAASEVPAQSQAPRPWNR